MLTLEMLKEMEPETIFSYGHDFELGRWVAVRGGIHDWAIYATKKSFKPTATELEIRQYIASQGDKVWCERALQLVDSDKEAAAWYRE